MSTWNSFVIFDLPFSFLLTFHLIKIMVTYIFFPSVTRLFIFLSFPLSLLLFFLPLSPSLSHSLSLSLSPSRSTLSEINESYHRARLCNPCSLLSCLHHELPPRFLLLFNPYLALPFLGFLSPAHLQTSSPPYRVLIRVLFLLPLYTHYGVFWSVITSCCYSDLHTTDSLSSSSFSP